MEKQMITEYLTTDNIAVYAAFVATLALIISILQHWNSIKDKKVLLAASYKKHPDYDENLKMLGVPYDPMTGEGGSNTAELYIVTIRNIGNVNAFISKVYGISQDGTRHNVLVRGNTNSSIMTEISKYKIEQIPAKSQQDYSIYFNTESQIFDLKQCIVIDGTGKKWEGVYNG
jgi:hypothetical protein